MNWLLLGIGVYVLLILGTFIFVYVRALKHPDQLIVNSQWRTRVGLFFQNMLKSLSNVTLWVIAFQLLCGLALVIWAIVAIIRAIW
jgi:hypothetical protein